MAHREIEDPIQRGPVLPNKEPAYSYLWIKQNIDAIYESLNALLGRTGAQPFTAAQLSVLRNALQAGGAVPLNLTGLTGSSSQAILIGSSANLAATNPLLYGAGSLFLATNTGAIFVNTGSNWNTAFPGVRAGALGSLTGSLAAIDAGFIYQATDYGHSYRWNGNAYNFAPGDASAYIVAAANGTPPQGGLWFACNGANATVAQDGGSTATVTTPDLNGNNTTGNFGVTWYMRR